MKPLPVVIRDDYRGSGKLAGKVALITGGDSGIGRATAVLFAREGADVAIVHLSPDEHDDARETARMIEDQGRTCLVLRGDIADESFCKQAVHDVTARFDRLDILINNAGEQHPTEDLADIDEARLDRTFRTNIYSMFFLARAGEPHEVATCFLFLASQDSSYMTGQVLHPNGGEIINA